MTRGVCSVCAHSEREEIDRALVGGVSVRRIEAGGYGLSRSAIDRHKQAHLPRALVQLETADKRVAMESALVQLQRLIPRVDALFTRAERSRKTADAFKAAKELRACLELYARLNGELDTRPSVTVNLLSSPSWMLARSTIAAAVRDYPDAAVAMADALLELERGANGNGHDTIDVYA